MTDQEIAALVQTVLKAIPTDGAKAAEIAAVQACAALVTNLLQNINAIANRKS